MFQKNRYEKVNPVMIFPGKRWSIEYESDINIYIWYSLKKIEFLIIALLSYQRVGNTESPSFTFIASYVMLCENKVKLPLIKFYVYNFSGKWIQRSQQEVILIRWKGLVFGWWSRKSTMGMKGSLPQNTIKFNLWLYEENLIPFV